MNTLPRYLRHWAWVCTVACATSACSDEDSARQKEHRWGIAPSPLVFGQPVEGGLGGSGEESSGGYDEPDPTNRAKKGVAPGDPGHIPVDPPRTWSLYCGDGAWDPDLEECDAGPVAQDDITSVCSPNCQTRDVLVVDPSVTGRSASRRLGLGRHPLAGSQLTGAMTWVEWGDAEALSGGVSGSVPQIVVQTLDLHNNPDTRLVVADKNLGDNPTLGSNPVVAAPYNGSIVVAYNDLNGDGSELGVALKTLTQVDGNWNVGPVSFANQTTVGAQADPDLMFTRQGLIGAWVDFSDPVGPRVVARNLSTSENEIEIVAPGPPVGAVALAALPRVLEDSSPTAGFAVPDRAWALAFREGEGEGGESIGVYSAGQVTRIQPALLGDSSADVTHLDGIGGAASVPELVRPMPGHIEDRPGIAHLSAHRVAVAFTVGVDPALTGVANVFRIWVAVVNLKTGAVEGVTEVIPQNERWSSNVDSRSLRQPALISFGEPSRMYLAWRSEGALGSSDGEDLWLKRLDWDEEWGVIDFHHPEVLLTRRTQHTGGDQRAPALAAMFVPGQAWLDVPTLGMAWEDWGVQYDSEQARPDILLQVAPTPMRRGPPVETECGFQQCGIGQGPCVDDTSCEEGLVCAQERGPWYGLGHTTPVCEPSHCHNGVQDADEEGVDCGGSCGKCFDCPDRQTYWGTANFCSLVCQCGMRDGDCDADFECEPGLSCIHDVGASIGLPAAIDLCEADHCHNGVLDADEYRRDCGGADCLPCVNGTPTHCVDVPCTVGGGDCLSEGASCAPGLVCSPTAGVLFGLDEGVGVCVEETCPEDRGDPYSPDFCSESCKCPPGLGLCDSTAECLDSQCVPDRGLYFGLASEDAVCIPDHCFDGVQNFGETQVDCGGVCGSECPSCEVDPTFRSFEDSTQWGIVNYWPVGIHPSSSVSTSQDATDGEQSLAYSGCGYQEAASVVIDGTQFESVGELLLIDVKPQIGPGGNPWDWVGGFLPRVWVDGVVYDLSAEFSWARTGANQWHTVSIQVPQLVRDAFLTGTQQIQFRFGMNRNCGADGAVGSAMLVDNLRFGGNAVFRSDCDPDDETDGTGGGSGTGGATGGGGGTGSGGETGSGGAGTGTGGAAGSGGSGGTGGTGGTGDETSVADEVFGFEDPSLWTGNPATTSDSTQGDTAFTFGGGYHSVTGGPFHAADVAQDAVLAVDIKLPASTSGGSGVGGQLEFHFACPSVGLYDQYVGSIQFWDKPIQVWFTGYLAVPQHIQTALGSQATDCTVRMVTNMWSHAPGGMISVDNLRFEPPSTCGSYTQQASPPFSLGMPIVPNGTQVAPYPICNASQLQHVVDNPTLWGANFALEANLDLTALSGKIGGLGQAFSGTFDGKGHVLANYSLTDSQQGAGLFGVVVGDGVINGSGDGVVKNLILSNFDVSGASHVGALAGQAEGALFQNVVVVGSTVAATGSFVGGIVGSLAGTLLESSADAVVTGSNAGHVGGAVGYTIGSVQEVVSYGNVTLAAGAGNVGGLIGTVSGGTVIDCQAFGDVTSGSSRAGGLVGSVFDEASVSGSLATGAVTLTGTAQTAGGFVGYGEDSTIERTLALGHVNAPSQVGGFIGAADSGLVIRDSAAHGNTAGGTLVGGFLGQSLGSGAVTLQRCAARGSVVATDSYGGGFIGSAQAASISDSYAWGAVSASQHHAGGFIAIATATSVQRSYSSGSVASAGTAGAFVGSHASGTTFNGSFATSQNNGGLALVGEGVIPAGLSFVSNTQLATQGTFTNVGWDFANVWIMDSTAGRPVLR